MLYIRYFKCVTTTNVLVFWSASLSCLPVCQSNFSGWFRSQGKHRATLEFKSSGCAVSNNLIYDSSLCQSQSNSQSYIVCTHPFLQGKGVVEPPTKFKKRGGLTGPQLLEEMTFFRGQGVQLSHNKLKSEIFNDRKTL